MRLGGASRMALRYYAATKNKKTEGFMGLLRIARTPLVAVGAEATVNEAVRTMAQASIGAIGVTDRNRVIGIFSERDLMLRVVLEKRDPERTHMRDVMTSPVETIHRDSTADEALKVMLEKHIRHLPVIDRDGTLCGMISMRNLLHDKVEELTDQLDSLEAYFTADGFGG
jgi:CBS domain-containing protein